MPMAPHNQHTDDTGEEEMGPNCSRDVLPQALFLTSSAGLNDIECQPSSAKLSKRSEALLRAPAFKARNSNLKLAVLE